MDAALRDRLDTLSGYLEWLKTDQMKKGGHERIPEITKVADLLERLAKKLVTSRHPHVNEAGTGDPKGDPSTGPSGRRLQEIVTELETAILSLTDNGQVPTPDRLHAISHILGELRAELSRGDNPVP